ncbi:MAG: adenosylcobalamin-dependent ribonucleoside-diphosphate reductase [Candidatus Pacearchaeota archaeon]
MNDVALKEIIIAERIQAQKGNLPDYVEAREFEERVGGNRKYAFEKKYSHRNESGEIVESPSEAIYRMALTMAEVEESYGATPEQVEQHAEDFFNIISKERFSPGGRIWTNAGTKIKGLFNCYVLPVHDSMDKDEEGSIYDSVANAAMIHKNGGGTGYNFSELRPRGTFVQSSKGIASGPVSFIGQFDKETEIINSGNRRGANMGILDVTHPDILDFIYAKSKRGEMTNFNVSIGAFDRFMGAARDKEFYGLEFPEGKPLHYTSLEQMVRNIEENKLGASGVGEEPRPASLRLGSKEIIPGKTEVVDSFSGEVAGRVNKEGNVELYAPYVLDRVAKLAHETADPGMIFLDKINKTNPLPKLGPIKATNPCGEQPLHPYDACNLGSTLLSNFVIENENGENEIDYDGLEDTVRIATRFMDNVNDANKGPIQKVEETVKSHRRIGMGVMGLADMLIEMGVQYDSEEGRDLAREVMGFQTNIAKETSVNLAKEKGVFPAFEGSAYDTGKEEDRVRNIDRTTIAPTGTISMLYDVSSGVEPIFSVLWTKHIRGGDALQYVHPVFEKECKKRGIDIDKVIPLIEENQGGVQGIEIIPEDMQRLFKTALDIKYEDHILMQAAIQEKVDNAVSKTINMPNSATIEDVKSAYIMAWENDLKGITVYRDGSKSVQVLTTGHGNKKEEVIDENIPSVNNPMKIPSFMPAFKIKQNTPFGNMHLKFIIDPKRDYAPVEVFGSLGNAGEDEAANMEGLGRLTSLWLRSGGGLEGIISQLEGIGSGRMTVTRDGGIQSLEMGFARGLQKFEAMRKNYNMEAILTGKLDYSEVEGQVSDSLRTRNKIVNGKDDVDSEESEEKTNVKKSERCPDPDEIGCKGTLIQEEGCSKCRSCGYSRC